MKFCTAVTQVSKHSFQYLLSGFPKIGPNDKSTADLNYKNCLSLQFLCKKPWAWLPTIPKLFDPLHHRIKGILSEYRSPGPAFAIGRTSYKSTKDLRRRKHQLKKPLLEQSTINQYAFPLSQVSISLCSSNVSLYKYTCRQWSTYIVFLNLMPLSDKRMLTLPLKWARVTRLRHFLLSILDLDSGHNYVPVMSSTHHAIFWLASILKNQLTM